MTEGKRPGGLTALAVINFIFFFASLLSLATFAFIGKIPTNQMDERQKAQIEAFQSVGTPTLVLLAALTLVIAVLLLLSGIGYLKQKRVLGRVLGNVYAVVAIADGILSSLLFGAEIGGGFNLSMILGMIYPVLTLILVNTTFKEDLVN